MTCYKIKEPLVLYLTLRYTELWRIIICNEECEGRSGSTRTFAVFLFLMVLLCAYFTQVYFCSDLFPFV